MKFAKKLFAVLLSAALALMVAVPAFAAGETGSITIFNATQGQTYSVYKIFDASQAGENSAYYVTDLNGEVAQIISAQANYTTTDGKVIACPFTISDAKDSQGRYAVTVKPSFINNGVVSADVTTWIENMIVGKISAVTFGENNVTGGDIDETNSALVKATTNVLTFSGLDYGYYYIKSSLGATVTINQVTPKAEVFDKNYPNTPTENRTKVITAVNDVAVAGGGSLAESAELGDKISFKIGFTAANFITVTNEDTGKTDYEMVEEYTVTDIPDGLDINTATLLVKVNNTEIEPYDETTNPNGYKVTKADADVEADEENGIAAVSKGTVTITIPWARNTGSTVTNSEGDPVPEYVTIYNAPATVEITYDAEVTRVDTAGVARNSAKVGGKARTVDGEPDDINPEPTPGDTITTYSFDLVKTDAGTTVEGNTTYKVLSKAEFELYDVKENGTAITFVKESDSSYRVATLDEEKDNTVNTTTTIIAGNVTVKGLDGETTYWLEETKAPDGYNLLTEREPVSFKVIDENDNKPGDSGYTDTYGNLNATIADNIYVSGGVQVINETGTTLPSTGGMGTTIFYVLGGVLVVGAGVLLITKKRMNGEA